MIDELAQIVALSNERLYTWLHTLAVLTLDYSNHIQEQKQENKEANFSFGKKPRFTLGANYLGYMVSTKSIVSRLWQRLLSRHILSLQIETFKETKSFMPDISTVLYGCQIEEFKAVNARSVRMMNFCKAAGAKNCSY